MSTRLGDVGRLIAVFGVVGAVVGPIGYAMEGLPSMLWALGGAFAWVTIFALAARSRKDPAHRWALVGGWICGTAWALGWPIARGLTDLFTDIWPGSWGMVQALD